jgi:hypothetical protein
VAKHALRFPGPDQQLFEQSRRHTIPVFCPGGKRWLDASDKTLRFESEQQRATADHWHVQPLRHAPGTALIDEGYKFVLRGITQHRHFPRTHASTKRSIQRDDDGIGQKRQPGLSRALICFGKLRYLRCAGSVG